MNQRSPKFKSTEYKVLFLFFILVAFGFLVLTNYELGNHYGTRGIIPSVKFWLENPAKYTLDGVMFELLFIVGILIFRDQNAFGTNCNLFLNVAGVLCAGWAVWGSSPPILLATILGALIYVVELLLSDSGSSWDRNRLLIFLGNKETRFTPNRYRFALIGLPFVGASLALAIYKHQFPNCIPSIWVTFPLVIAFGVRQIDIAFTRNQYGTPVNTEN